MTEEERRLEESRTGRRDWKRWGPYVSERAWGTVREDYSADGTAWEYFPHDHARSRAYRWSEDGIAGICDRHQLICFAIALWNGRDPILKERLFGLTTNEGQHGEDVKEYSFYLDCTPTHSYMKYLYKYPQAAFPYEGLIAGNQRRSRMDAEYELLDTGVFDDDRYFDVFVEYAKATVEDLCIRITVANRGPDARDARSAADDVVAKHLGVGLWTRAGRRSRRGSPFGMRGSLKRITSSSPTAGCSVRGRRSCCSPRTRPTSRVSSAARIERGGSRTASTTIIVSGAADAVNPAQRGTKAAARYRLHIGGGQSAVGQAPFAARREDRPSAPAFGPAFDELFATRIREADDFYHAVAAPSAGTADARAVQRQSFAGLLWNKQFYHYDVRRWLRGDPVGDEPPRERQRGRNSGWTNVYNADVVSMPDKWEFPWYAAWDLAFHCIPLALVDPDFAKEQLLLLLRERYMHPNGQLPAYEWAFSDVNPPVHAWAAWRVYRIEQKRFGRADRNFLERVFQKLLLNFTWWVNRHDAEGLNIFQGGFLGLDNIGAFDRSAMQLDGGTVEQSDATSWMGMYCLN